MLGQVASRAHPAIAVGYAAYEAHEYIKSASSGLPVPRDRLNASDSAITWPSTGWTHNYYEGSYVQVAASNGWAPPPIDAFTWYPNGSTPASTPCNTTGPHQYEQFPGIDPLTIPNPALPYPRNAAFSRHQHVDLRPVAPPFTVGDTHGMDLIERHVKTSSAADDPSFANPPRVSPASPPVITIISTPVATPYHLIPHRLPSPWLSPSEQTQWGPGPATRNLPWEVPSAPVPTTTPSPFEFVPPPITIGRPSPATGTEIITNPDASIDPATRPGQSPSPQPYSPAVPRRPPSKGTKEKKQIVKYNGVVQAIRKVVGETTEFLDALDAFYEALPKHLRPGYYQLHRKDGSTFWIKRWNPSVLQRAQAVYRHFGQLDAAQVFRNVIGNEIQDRVIGATSQRLQRAAREAGMSRTLQFGPWDTAYSEFWLTQKGP